MEEINEQAVWERVSAASRVMRPERDGPGPVAPELLEAMEGTYTAAADCRRLSARANQEGQRVLRQLASEKTRQARQLGGLYYFLTGQKPARKQSQQAQAESYAEGLRRLMQGTERAAGRMEALSERATGEVQRTLRNLAEQERTHFIQLLNLLGGI